MAATWGHQDDPLARWGDDDVTRQYVVLGPDQPSDPGEAAALAALSDDLDGARLLDLGIGAGRTTRLLAGRAGRYVGVDYSPQMVALAQQASPEADLRVGDARDLSWCPDASVDVVVFSFNGIDAVDHPGRQTVLRECHRVLRPGGRLLLSSLNRDAPGWPEKPWQLRPAGSTGWARARGTAHALARSARHARGTVRGWRNYLGQRHLRQDGDGWSRRLLRAHDFRFLVYFAPVPVTAAQLRAAGFVVQSAWANQGHPVDPDHPDQRAGWVHYLCRSGPRERQD